MRFNSSLYQKTVGELKSVKKKSNSLIEYFQSKINYYAHVITPYNFVKYLLCPKQLEWYENKQNYFIDAYVIIWLFIFMIFLKFGNIKNIWLFYVLVVVRFIDMFSVYLQSMGISTLKIQSGIRSLILSLINYGEIIFIFAVIYKIWAGKSGVEALYISIFAMTTIHRTEGVPQYILAIQSLLGVFFVAIIIAMVVGYISKKED